MSPDACKYEHVYTYVQIGNYKSVLYVLYIYDASSSLYQYNNNEDIKIASVANDRHGATG